MQLWTTHQGIISATPPQLKDSLGGGGLEGEVWAEKGERGKGFLWVLQRSLGCVGD